MPPQSNAPEGETLIRDRISTLEEQVSKLRERLETVLQPVSPAATDATKPVTSQVRARLENLIEQMQDIHARLEL